MNLLMNLSRLRPRALLDPFAKIKMCGRASKVMYPLREVLLLVCGTIASGDDNNDIVDWGNVSGQVAVAPQRSVMNSPCGRQDRPLFPPKQTRRCAAANHGAGPKHTFDRDIKCAVADACGQNAT
jgi:hypothetical protein